VSQVGHGQVDHEDDSFVVLADEAAQDPEGSAVGQEAGDEDEGVRGRVQAVFERDIVTGAGLVALCHDWAAGNLCCGIGWVADSCREQKQRL